MLHKNQYARTRNELLMLCPQMRLVTGAVSTPSFLCCQRTTDDELFFQNILKQQIRQHHKHHAESRRQFNPARIVAEIIRAQRRLVNQKDAAGIDPGQIAPAAGSASHPALARGAASPPRGKHGNLLRAILPDLSML